MTVSYAREKLNLAVRSMATGKGRIKERLLDAYIYHLGNIQPDRDLPVDLHAQFQKIMSHARTHEATDPMLGSYHESLKHLTEDEAMLIAKEVSELASQVELAADL